MTNISPDNIRLVPKYADIEDAFKLMDRYGWQMIGEREPRNEDLVQWTVPSLDVKISWYNDPNLTWYFTVEGPDRQIVVDQIENVADILHPEEFTAYLDRFSSDTGLHNGLSVVAAAAPKSYDQATFDVILTYLRDNRHHTRAFAAFAAANIGWKEFIEPVSQLLQDPDDTVRRDAQAVLEVLALDA